MSAPTPSPGPAVFLSYAREDSMAAQRIAEALRAFGVEVWFDQRELRGGDTWDQKIRNQIKTCALFVPLVSAQTEARTEGYFRREWKLAVDRTHDMAGNRAFIVPVVVDDTTEVEANVPEEFMRYQWTRLANGVPSPQFVEQIKRLLEAPQKAHAGTTRTTRAAVATTSDVRLRPDPAQGPGVSAAVWVAVAVLIAGGTGLYFALRPAANAPRVTPAPTAPAAGATSRPAPAAQPSATTADEKSVAVLPFANLSGDKEQEYFSDGLTEEVLNALARERDLRVPGRASAFSFKGKNISAAEIARALNVTRLVEGSVRRDGKRVRISVQLTRAADGFSEELGTFTEELTDIFALQDKVARAVVEKITRRALTGSPVVLTRNPEAYDTYLRGRALQTRAASNAAEAAKLYEQAVTLDPTFALAWARFAEARFRPYGAMADRSPELVTATRHAIDRALALQPNLPEALIARANWLRYVEFDYVGARRDLERAESLQSPTAELRSAQGMLAREVGDWPEAFRRVQEALAIDPQNGDYTNAFAVGFYTPRGEFSHSDPLLARAIAIQGPSIPTPFNNRISLRSEWRGPAAALRLLERAPPGQANLEIIRAGVLADLGRVDEARALVDAVERTAVVPEAGNAMTAPNRAPVLLLMALGREELARRRAEENRTEALKQFTRGNRAPNVRNNYVRALIVLGQRAEAEAALEEWRRATRDTPSVFRRMTEFNSRAAGYYALLGRTDDAVELLRELRANGYHASTTRHSYEFKRIQGDPRVQALFAETEAWAKAQPDPVDP